MRIRLLWREEDGARLSATVWRAGPGYRMISSALLGGGIGPAGWVLNAQVAGGYSRLDPVEHLREIAASHGLGGRGVGMLTAASVDRTMRRADEGVTASATVGLRVPTWAAAPAGKADPELAPIHLPAADRRAGQPIEREEDRKAERTAERKVERDTIVRAAVPEPGRADGVPEPEWRPGTINIIVEVPVALSDAALVNAVMTATEAKTQALLTAGYPCTGTASDAICVAAPIPGEGVEEPFAGPRSLWGGRVARAVHAAVHAGALGYSAYLNRTKV
jgi:adenosylcobinamide amidohydrolase